MAVLGIVVLVLNVRFYGMFSAYCKDVALEKGEMALLASPDGGSDGGLNGYAQGIYDELEAGRVDGSLSEGLQRRARILSARQSRVYAATAVYFLVLIYLGFCLKW